MPHSCGAREEGKWCPGKLSPPGRRALRPCVPYQGVRVVAHERPVVVDLPLQDDEQEEQAQQDVAQVAEDVVEGAAGSGSARQCPGTLPIHAPAALSHAWGTPAARPPPLPEVPQRVGAQKVVVADVLVACHIHYLDRKEVGDLMLANPPCLEAFVLWKHSAFTRCK